MNKFGSLLALFGGFGFLYIALIMALTFVSDNKGESSSNFLPSVEARINFFQDSFRQDSYDVNGSTFWSSENYYNNTYNTATVSLQGETPPLENNISTIVTRITRNSH